MITLYFPIAEANVLQKLQGIPDADNLRETPLSGYTENLPPHGIAREFSSDTVFYLYHLYQTEASPYGYHYAKVYTESSDTGTKVFIDVKLKWLLKLFLAIYFGLLIHLFILENIKGISFMQFFILLLAAMGVRNTIHYTDKKDYEKYVTDYLQGLLSE